MKRRIRLPRNVIVVAFVALASGFGQDLITPVLPAYLALIGIDRAGIGLIDGLLQGATSIFRLISGVLSDRFKNRKGFVFAGYALSSVARPLLAVSATFPAVAALRLADGAGKGGKDAPRDALIADSADGAVRGRAFGFHRLVDTAGSVFGPLVAAAVLFTLSPQLEAYRIIFLLAAVPGAIALGLIVFGVREPSHAPVPHTKNRAMPLPVAFWAFCAAAGLAAISRMNDSLLLLRAGDFGVTHAFIPILFAGFTLLYAVLSYPLGIWIDRIGKLPLIVAGWIALAGAEWGLSFGGGIAAAIALFALYGVSLALTEGSGRALIADLVPEHARGSAYGVFQTVIGAAVVAGGYGLGRLSDTVSTTFAFQISTLGTLLAAFLLLAAAPRSACISTSPRPQ